jgi:hypothetical protein
MDFQNACWSVRQCKMNESRLDEDLKALSKRPRGRICRPTLMQRFGPRSGGERRRLALERENWRKRIVHAKGSAAHGTLTITNDITKYSKAGIFSKLGKQVSAYLRFSTVAGERGAADAERDVRRVCAQILY